MSVYKSLSILLRAVRALSKGTNLHLATFSKRLSTLETGETEVGVKTTVRATIIYPSER